MSIRMKNPSHPGAFVREMVIDPLGLNVKEASRVLGVARATLSKFLNERASLRPKWRSGSTRRSGRTWRR